MDAKLTLKLDNSVIERAKIYAKKNNTSLSQLIENYLNLLTESSDEKSEITPLVKSLSGVIDPPENYDYKKAYKSHILKKYSR